MIIKTKKDAERFIEDFKDYAENDHENGDLYIRFFDGGLSVGGNNGFTKLACTRQGEYYHFGYGTNWCDQGNSDIDEPVKFLYRKRKWINRMLKDTAADY